MPVLKTDKIGIQPVLSQKKDFTAKTLPTPIEIIEQQ
jgi:hypothetical protein